MRSATNLESLCGSKVAQGYRIVAAWQQLVNNASEMNEFHRSTTCSLRNSLVVDLD
jgi:hypothetical protein